MKNLYIPKDITLDQETGKHVASFTYSKGVNYALLYNLKQNLTVNGSLFNKKEFCVCYGDVMCEVESTDFPEITRRII